MICTRVRSCILFVSCMYFVYFYWSHRVSPICVWCEYISVELWVIKSCISPSFLCILLNASNTLRPEQNVLTFCRWDSRMQFLEKNILCFLSEFHWCLLQRIQLTINIRPANGFALNSGQAITWTSDNRVQQGIFQSAGFNGLIFSCSFIQSYVIYINCWFDLMQGMGIGTNWLVMILMV